MMKDKPKFGEGLNAESNLNLNLLPIEIVSLCHTEHGIIEMTVEHYVLLSMCLQNNAICISHRVMRADMNVGELDVVAIATCLFLYYYNIIMHKVSATATAVRLYYENVTPD